jgi:hypothetical protein
LASPRTRSVRPVAAPDRPLVFGARVPNWAIREIERRTLAAAANHEQWRREQIGRTKEEARERMAAIGQALTWVKLLAIRAERELPAEGWPAAETIGGQGGGQFRAVKPSGLVRPIHGIQITWVIGSRHQSGNAQSRCQLSAATD